LLIPNDLLTAAALFDGVPTPTLTVADDPVAPTTLLDSADTATFPIPQHLLSDVILDSADPAALGVPPNQIPALALLDSFSSTTLGIVAHIILSQSRYSGRDEHDHAAHPDKCPHDVPIRTSFLSMPNHCPELPSRAARSDPDHAYVCNVVIANTGPTATFLQ
jgi:hypothetical protein